MASAPVVSTGDLRLACLWRSVDGERDPVGRARNGVESSPCWRLLSQMKEAAGERLRSIAGRAPKSWPEDRVAEWPVTGCAGSWRCYPTAEMGGLQLGYAGRARESWA
jgi:hypothetical protein